MTVEEFAILLEVAEGAIVTDLIEPEPEESNQPGAQYLH